MLSPILDVFRFRYIGVSWKRSCRSIWLGLEFREEIVLGDIRLKLLANT